MISKSEILELTRQANLQPHVVEKDYVLGWLLAGINQHLSLRDNWLFKGGTCLKKCYFETYRFSEDLDFTLLDAGHINEAFLRATFTEISEWIYDQSGIVIPVDRMLFDIFKNPRGVDACQGRIFYRGPATYSGKDSMPRVKLDLTADESVVDEPVKTPVRHDYSDCPEDGIAILSYSYEEVFAEKIRALKERTRPRDLYDVINFFRRPESADVAEQVRTVLQQKCEFKNISFPTLEDLGEHKDQCAAGWQDQLGHQLQFLPPFESFWNELTAFFSWLEHPEAVETVELPVIPLHAGETSAAAIGANTPYFSILERVRFAAVNRLCVELDYRKENGERSTYLIEPYSLRTTSEGNMILYGVKLPAEQIRGFRTDRIIGTTSTALSFSPRYSIDFIPEGPVHLSARHTTPRSLTLPRASNSLVTSRGKRKYVYSCNRCGKLFSHSTRNSRLNPHKDKQGNKCYGRSGSYVETKY